MTEPKSKSHALPGHAPSSSATFRERQRGILVDVTEGVISREGLAAVQARRIAKDAGCSIGTIYNIFGDIDGLILAANERTLHALGALLEASSQRVAGDPLPARLMALARSYLDFATADRRRWRAVFEHRLPDGTEVPAFYVEDRVRLLALIEAQLVDAILDPSARFDAARALFSSVHGIVTLSLDEKLSTFDPAHCERQIRFIVETVARGLHKR